MTGEDELESQQSSLEVGDSSYVKRDMNGLATTMMRDKSVSSDTPTGPQSHRRTKPNQRTPIGDFPDTVQGRARRDTRHVLAQSRPGNMGLSRTTPDREDRHSQGISSGITVYRETEDD